MVNTCEPLINAVKFNRLKMLISLNQKVRSTVWSPVACSIMGTKTTGGQRAPNPPLSWARNTVSSYRSSTEVGTPQGEPTAMRGKDEGKSAGRLVRRRIRGSTSPDAKAGKLPPGLLSREHVKNRQRK
jgi:hypothetical protein